MPTKNTQETFKAVLNDTFQISYDQELPPMDLKLVEVSEKRELGKGYETYTLLFQGSKDLGGHLVQKTWTLEHPSLGKRQLFLVPVGEATTHYEYESVISYQLEEQPAL